MTLYKRLRGSEPFFLIAGPCVIESEAIMLSTAEYLKNLAEKLGLPIYSVYDGLKAMRKQYE